MPIVISLFTGLLIKRIASRMTLLFSDNQKGNSHETTPTIDCVNTFCTKIGTFCMFNEASSVEFPFSMSADCSHDCIM